MSCESVAERAGGPPRAISGFTLIELTITLLIMSVTLAALSVAFSAYRSNTTARRAAEVFAQDLSVGRSRSVRSREVVSVRFDEVGMGYVLVSASGDSIITRSFTPTSGLRLDAIDLQSTGDSLFFDSRGRIDWSGVGSALGTALFVSGTNQYTVRFNTLGASRVAAQ
jgi:prepilin-type N-terminal cleavage/methylation domain-containing protein